MMSPSINSVLMMLLREVMLHEEACGLKESDFISGSNGPKTRSTDVQLLSKHCVDI